MLHGPASLLYGSSAIGGVVNVLDKRIPRTVPDEAVHLDLDATYASAAAERNLSGVVELPLGERFVIHADGSYARSDDLRIGGFVLSRPVRAEALASADPLVRALAGLRGRLPNSAARTWNVAGGAAFIDSGGDAGFAISRYDSLYGVPTRFDLGTGGGEAVRLAVTQTRVDARAGITIDGGPFEKLSFRYGFADYQHKELGEDGTVSTTFRAKAMEGRLELSQAKRGSWRGATGVQILLRDFDIIGDEAFVPKNQTQQVGVFTLQEIDFGSVKAEAAARYEHSRVSTVFSSFRGQPNAFDRSFDALSGSIGASIALAQGVRAGINLSRTQRAPSAEELLANGPHGGTQAFEIGDRALRPERAIGAEAVLRIKGEGYSLESSFYWSRFADYIYEDQTGAIDLGSGLPVFQYRQGRARYLGAEAQATVTVARQGDFEVKADLLADYTNARLLGGLGPVPRIPPLRLLGGVEVSHPQGDARIEVERAFRQSRVAAFETPTDSYILVNASISIRPFIDRPGTALVISANNILDADARRHPSFLKDFAPLAGRDLRLSLRFTL